VQASAVPSSTSRINSGVIVPPNDSDHEDELVVGCLGSVCSFSWSRLSPLHLRRCVSFGWRTWGSGACTGPGGSERPSNSFVRSADTPGFAPLSALSPHTGVKPDGDGCEFVWAHSHTDRQGRRQRSPTHIGGQQLVVAGGKVEAELTALITGSLACLTTP
jgi:hypothetical protein